MKKTMILLIMIITTNLMASFNKEQLNKINFAFKMGKSVVTKDGTTFEYALPSIMGAESFWGKLVIGDRYNKTGKLKSLYKSSLGNYQIKLSTAKLVIKSNKKLRKKYKYLIYNGNEVYSKYLNNKKELNKLNFKIKNNKKLLYKNEKKIKYYNDVLKNKKWLIRYKNKEKKAILTMKWAKKELKYTQKKLNKNIKIIKNSFSKINKINKNLVFISKKINKDIKLINLLLTNYKFGAEIAANYLKMIYNEALSRHFDHPYRRTIGRYNGGWNNLKYFYRVKNHMKKVKKII